MKIKRKSMPVVCHLYQGQEFNNEVSVVCSKVALKNIQKAITDAIHHGKGDIKIAIERDSCCDVHVVLHETEKAEMPEIAEIYISL